MKRREFLKGGLWLPVTLMLPGVLTGCQTAIAKLASKPVWEFLKDWILNTGGQIVANQVEDWLAGLSQSSQDAVWHANKYMAGFGFTDFSHSQVLAHNNDTFCYYVGNRDGFNGCTPVLSAQYNPLFVEGPMMVGLALAAQDWPGISSISAAQALIPRYAYSPGRGSQFNADLERPLKFDTDAGKLSVNYTTNLAERRGLVGVVAEQNNGGLLFGRDYEIAW